MSVRPLLFVDVDGVINCPSPSNVHEPTHHLALPQSSQVAAALFADSDDAVEQPLWLVPGVVERLLRLSEVFEMRWATSWMQAAPEMLGDLIPGSARWPVLTCGDMKIPAILAAVGQNQTWAFVDDDVHLELRESTWRPDPQQHLLIKTDKWVGLTDQQTQQILDFGRTRR